MNLLAFASSVQPRNKTEAPNLLYQSRSFERVVCLVEIRDELGEVCGCSLVSVGTGSLYVALRENQIGVAPREK